MIEQYLQSFDLFSDEEINQLVQLFEVRHLNKNDIFINEGKISNEVAFVIDGLFRSFYISEAGKDITYCFRFPNQFIAAYSSFITGNPSVENIQAITKAQILVIKKEVIQKLSIHSLKWTTFLKIVAEQQYLELENRIFQLQRDSASKRYKSLMENQPTYIQKLPLQYLASFLGITQRHLSRIRSEVSF